MLQKLTALQTRRSTRIIESGRRLNFAATGFVSGPSSGTRPEYAFGKWWWADVVNNSTANPQLRIMSSTNGESWTTHSTLLNYSAPFGKLGYILHKRFIFSDGYCLFIGRLADWQNGVYSNERGFVGITNDGINWNYYQTSVFVPDGLFNLTYTFGNGLLYAQNADQSYQFASLASNFTDWQPISYSVANGSSVFYVQFFAGNFYICSTVTGNHNIYVSPDLVTSSLVTSFPYFTGRTFIKDVFNVVEVNGLKMLWCITEEGSPKVFYFWKSFDGVYWEGSSLPAGFYDYQQGSPTSAIFQNFGGGGGYVAIEYRTLFVGKLTDGTLASSNLLNFGNFENAQNIAFRPTCYGPSFISAYSNTQYTISP